MICLSTYGQTNQLKLSNDVISFNGEKELTYNLRFKKDNIYIIKVYQEHIDIEINLLNSDQEKVASVDLADGNKGYDKLEFVPKVSGAYTVIIRSVSPKPAPNGLVKLTITALGRAEIKRREKIATTLAGENAKDITTVDIKHFWEAYDKLKNARSFEDSVNIIQTYYLDHATNGLKEFQRVRYFSAEFYIERIKKYRKFYDSVRENTNLFLDPASLKEIISETRSIYPNGKPAKIALTMGPMSSGGALSNNYVLIGIEMLAGDKNCDVSEITNENLKTDILSRSNQTDVLNFVKETIAHEYIHTQQKAINKEACQCLLLENVVKEGVASFISEALIMKRKQETASRASLYATVHEKELWQEMKNELCTKNLQNWLFNASTSKERPGDLGYRIGYKIAEAFYNNQSDKTTAIREMIEMDDPLIFLNKSKYDLKFR